MSSPEPVNRPTGVEGFDAPLSDPASDLLDMDEHAQALARYIRRQESQLPFTIGIFGEWGEGKTTLVRFLCHYLSKPGGSAPIKPIKFVSFSAWPFTTSEKLWRALILEIAQVLYGLKKHDCSLSNIPVEETPKTTDSENQPASTGWLKTFTNFLTGDAFVIKQPAPQVDEYQELVEKLDRTDYGKVSNRATSVQLDHEATMSAVINGAVAVLGTVSPLVAGLRSLLGIEPKIDATKLVKGTNETSREAIESLQNFQDIFRQMLDDKAQGEPVYVFIDDLDRAQPDVALDIMESVRIALSQVRCVFIIAVDERLIAQGLRLRYKELFADENASAFATKGQEYLEKIIQFRMRVPPRRPEQGQRFISAQFPQWMPAGDIIQTVVGNNPRRVKQYCQRLSFQNMIGSTPFTLGARQMGDAAVATVTNTEQEIRDGMKKIESGEQDTVQEAGAGGPASAPSEAVYLARILEQDFSVSELRDVFMELGVNYADFPGEEKADKARGLVATFKRNADLDSLREAMERIKPGVFP
jgi:hypothetical protein